MINHYLRALTMTERHSPITPPPELVQQWCHEDGDEIKTSPRWYQIVTTKAARWGADQELEACCEWVINTRAYDMTPGALRAARRPKLPPETIEVDGYTYRLEK
jgi:hypothetical protein